MAAVVDGGGWDSNPRPRLPGATILDRDITDSVTPPMNALCTVATDNRGVQLRPWCGEPRSIVHLTLRGMADVDALAQVLHSLTCREAPFAVMLEISDIALDRHRNLWPEVRRLPGGRARFGTWCRGAAYVFATPLCLSQAQIHLSQAQRIWGTRIHAGHDPDGAAQWLKAALE
jgi:hypothetical protein